MISSTISIAFGFLFSAGIVVASDDRIFLISAVDAAAEESGAAATYVGTTGEPPVGEPRAVTTGESAARKKQVRFLRQNGGGTTRVRNCGSRVCH